MKRRVLVKSPWSLQVVSISNVFFFYSTLTRIQRLQLFQIRLHHRMGIEDGLFVGKHLLAVVGDSSFASQKRKAGQSDIV